MGWRMNGHEINKEKEIMMHGWVPLGKGSRGLEEVPKLRG
jgi:hypothetical protein